MERSFETRLTVDGATVDERDVELLRGVDEHGSIHRASGELGRSYARMQQRIVDLEAAIGPLVDRQRGGADGGGSELTENARSLLSRFDRLEAAFAGVAAVEESVFSGRVVERTGELATVDTDAGRICALVPPNVTAVAVSVRSDAVTLTAPDDTPAPTETSARNQFTGSVLTVGEGEAVASVEVDIGAETPLLALVTCGSVEKLGLEPERTVVASFKATATRGVSE
ncbi:MULTISPECIES: TOBE domain-containing protein [Halostella]|uniref:TOBE domain-containing protein n=1 Tax=Halostella TaxID=1843185 RepID=UPI001080068E|nr:MULTISPECIES: TOBE domain-containing protein [Halostella]